MTKLKAICIPWCQKYSKKLISMDNSDTEIIEELQTWSGAMNVQIYYGEETKEEMQELLDRNSQSEYKNNVSAVEIKANQNNVIEDNINIKEEKCKKSIKKFICIVNIGIDGIVFQQIMDSITKLSQEEKELQVNVSEKQKIIQDQKIKIEKKPTTYNESADSNVTDAPIIENNEINQTLPDRQNTFSNTTLNSNDVLHVELGESSKFDALLKSERHHMGKDELAEFNVFKNKRKALVKSNSEDKKSTAANTINNDKQEGRTNLAAENRFIQDHVNLSAINQNFKINNHFESKGQELFDENYAVQPLHLIIFDEDSSDEIVDIDLNFFKAIKLSSNKFINTTQLLLSKKQVWSAIPEHCANDTDILSRQ